MKMLTLLTSLTEGDGKVGARLGRVVVGVFAFVTINAANVAHGQAPGTPAETRAEITISGGYGIGREDFGRPCVLMAAALGVETDTFRKAFSGVNPARGRGPTKEEERANKKALMDVLAPRGVTNERMDEVANYYRFRPQSGERWPTRPAKAYAVVSGGAVKSVVVTDPGAGYCSLPTLRVAGHPAVSLRPTLSLSRDLRSNGGIARVDVVLPAPPAGGRN